MILDHKLSWNSHITDKVVKCRKILFAIKNKIAKTVGPRPSIVRRAYKTLVIPMISYGCHLFAAKLNTVTLQDELTKLNRLACMSLGSVPQGTPTMTLEILYDIMPIDLEMQKIACKTYSRIKNKLPYIWDGRPTKSMNRVGHLRYWENMSVQLGTGVAEGVNDQQVKSRTWLKNFKVLDFETTRHDSEDSWGSFTCYGDGSRQGIHTGYGYVIKRYNQTIHEGMDYMGPRASVFQAEVRAISTIAKTLMQCCSKIILIRTDSQAAVTAISNTNTGSKTVAECKQLLNRLGAKNNVTIAWVKAHANHIGNEQADRLAKLGACQLGLLVIITMNPLLRFLT
jgi:ribonuclease HI